MLGQSKILYDKTSWPDGPWKTEVDQMQWTSETGFFCAIIRNPTGALCGYVGIPSSHPAFGRDYNGVDVDCHGGLTWGDSQSFHKKAELEPQDPDIFWFGFDCAHFADFMPNMPLGTSNLVPGIYRNMDFVVSEVESLAKQLKELENGDGKN